MILTLYVPSEFVLEIEISSKPLTPKLIDHLEVNGASPSTASMKLRVHAEAPKLLIQGQHQLKVENERLAWRRIKFENGLISDAKMATIEAIENRLCQLFDVQERANYLKIQFHSGQKLATEIFFKDILIYRTNSNGIYKVEKKLRL